MSMIHSVIASDKTKKVLEVISCFNKSQVPIAEKALIQQNPGAIISVKSYSDHSECIPDRK